MCFQHSKSEDESQEWSKNSCSYFFIYFFHRYLKWSLAVVVLHFLVGSTDQQHSSTVVLREREINRTWITSKISLKRPKRPKFSSSPTLIWKNVGYLPVKEFSKRSEQQKLVIMFKCLNMSIGTQNQQEHLLPSPGVELLLLKVWICCSTPRERKRERVREIEKQRQEEWRRELRGLNLLYNSPTMCSTTHAPCTHTWI